MAIGVPSKSVMKLTQTGAELENYLTFLTRRQAVTASNIANVDTPGYRTKDIAQPQSFGDIFQQQSLSSVEVQTGHTQNDGNNVDLDREARILAENTLRFNIATQMVKGEFKQLKMAIEEGKS